MEDIGMILVPFLIILILCCIGVCGVYYLWKKRQAGLELTIIDDVITRNSGYGEQSTKNFTVVPFRVSTTSSNDSPRGSQNSTLKGSFAETENASGGKHVSGKQTQKHNTFPMDAAFIKNEKEVRTLR